MNKNLHPAEQIVMIMERVYKYGMTTISGGNLSILDENGDLWITPSGVDKGTLTIKDIMCVKKDGTVAGKHKPSVELPFHQGIYEARPDIKAIVHAHPPALVSFSMARKGPNPKLLLHAYKNVADSLEVAAYAIPGSDKLKENISAEFAKGGDAVILENHGIVVGKSTIFDAFMLFETLEDTACMEINARTIGEPFELTEQDLQEIDLYKVKKLTQIDVKHHSVEEVFCRQEMIRLLERLYDRQLFTSISGSFSTRLKDGSILITPSQKDRKYIKEDELVLVHQESSEGGKEPCEFYELHQKIYEKNPELTSVIIANPRFLMAYAVTDVKYNTHIIPEAYIVLRDIEKMPFGMGEDHNRMIADKLAEDNPVLLINNGYAVVSGNSLLSVFDRLEVAEYSAKALVYSKSIGKVIDISDEDIEEIIEGFKLIAK
ncbi:class II aldolase/adducin family protein [Peribacillus butanolivorans]|uniref:class II aldolase/adducin family protein n=1 Tax=Peribacillus butanolivorans TaxID=421767 RepID=UPI00207D6EB5|nr:class II aldolase/adducin family protein [Peribacillus butanolivorans]MCO0598507.1 class II aldolase/adducin family protein [Peribacillus butanolivorans]